MKEAVDVRGDGNCFFAHFTALQKRVVCCIKYLAVHKAASKEAVGMPLAGFPIRRT